MNLSILQLAPIFSFEVGAAMLLCLSFRLFLTQFGVVIYVCEKGNLMADNEPLAKRQRRSSERSWHVQDVQGRYQVINKQTRGVWGVHNTRHKRMTEDEELEAALRMSVEAECSNKSVSASDTESMSTPGSITDSRPPTIARFLESADRVQKLARLQKKLCKNARATRQRAALAYSKLCFSNMVNNGCVPRPEISILHTITPGEDSQESRKLMRHKRAALAMVVAKQNTILEREATLQRSISPPPPSSGWRGPPPNGPQSPPPSCTWSPKPGPFRIGYGFKF